jgi:hypothetical protein
VAYRSAATNAFPDDFNAVPDLFLYDRLLGFTRLVSADQTSTTVAGNRSLKPVFSGDSRLLLFQSWAPDLLAGDFNQASDLFALDLQPPPIVDADNDGMDDPWELDHFGTLARDGTGDYDGDGATDLAEYLTGTEPADPASAFRAEIHDSGVPGQGPAITWPIAWGKSYRVQLKQVLTDPGWYELNGNVIFMGSRGYVLDPSPAVGQRFYRILLNP